MKKALALVMAIAMVASMAAVSFAATQIGSSATATNPTTNMVLDTNLYTYSKTTGYVDVDGTKVPFGKTVYVMFLDAQGNSVKADAVKSLKVDAKWEKGGEYIADVEIVKVGGTNGHSANYCIAVETTGSSLKEVSVVGEVSVKGKSYYEVPNAQGKLEGEKASINYKFDLELDLAYPEVDVTGDITAGTKTVYDFEDTAEEEVVINYGELDVEVETKNMKKVLIAYNDDENEEIVDAYIDADLLFINCVGTFRRTSEVTIDATDYPYLYEVVDGVLVEVDAEYDEWTEEFTFKTKTLGNYVLSDMELEVADEVVATNPSTGAAA